MRWKVCMVVTREVAKHVNMTVKSLVESGFDGVQLFAPRGVSLSDNDFVIRQRCFREASEAALFALAMSCDQKSLFRDVDFLLFLRGDIHLWRSAKMLMENTIEPNFIGVYFPHSPKPFFVGQESHLPCQGFGWCEVKVDEPVSGATCFAMNKHTAGLLAGPVARMLEGPQDRPRQWDYELAMLLRDYDVPSFVHTTSLALTVGSEQPTVPMDQRLNPRAVGRNWYLN